MPRTGRPPLTEDVVRERIRAYCDRYDTRQLNAEGFPVFPAGRRETPQHREWVSLYRAFQRVRQRASSGAACPICLRPGTGATAGAHPRCSKVVEFFRDLGPEALDRVRRAAFSDDAGAVVT
jgi:hypothetical protein